VEPREIKLPSPQVRIVKIEPEAVSVTLDELIVQKLPVKATLVGEPAIGYKVKEDEIQLDPNAVLVEGPKGQLEKFDAIPTERIDLVGRIRSFRRTLQLDLPPGIEAQSESLIDVVVPIKEESGEKALEHVPVRVLTTASTPVDFEISPEELSLILSGSHLQLEKITAATVMAYLDPTGLAPGTHTLSAKLVLPEDVSVKDPETLKVTVKIKPNSK